ncbi:hypothetical protein GOV11_00195 [Candidatus Woesearchaeota archaeon]|nr:hypothetical protein [Candidatus Woesearchaeota archaeon]
MYIRKKHLPPIQRQGQAFSFWNIFKSSKPKNNPLDILEDGKYSIDLKEALGLNEE